MTNGNLTTAAILADESNTLYRGPSKDRLPIADAHAAGLLVFSINRPEHQAGFGKPAVFGWYDTIEQAAAAVADATKASPEFKRISAHHRGWGYPDECVVYQAK